MRRGFPIRTSADQRSLASPRGFSQRATSFIASWRQGIHRTPLSRSTTHPPPPARRTKPRQDDRSPPPARTHSCGRHRHYSCLSQLTHTLGRTIPPHRRISPSEAPAARADNPSARSDSPSQRTCPHQAKARAGNCAQGSREHHDPPDNSALRMEAIGFEPTDPLLAKQVLSQLSYAPASKVRATGASKRHLQMETAPRRSASRGALSPPADTSSPQRGEKVWAREDLNLRPHAYQACALTN